MTDPEEKNLTDVPDEDIILTTDESRIIGNLRTYAKLYPHSELAVLIKVHDGQIKHGTLCLGAAPRTSTIRL
jgi:hypothetical protein